MQSLPANPPQRKRTDAEKHLFFPSRSPAEQPEKARVGHAQHKEQNDQRKQHPDQDVHLPDRQGELIIDLLFGVDEIRVAVVQQLFAALSA